METNQSENLTIQIQLTRSDIFRSLLLRSIRRPTFWIFPAILLIFGIYAYLTIQHPYGAIFAVFIYLSFQFLAICMAFRATIKQPDNLAPITFTFSAYGLIAQFQNAETKSAWALIKGARETADYFYIEMQRRSFHIVPKRAMTTEQASRLREILRAKLKLANGPDPGTR